jgi:hypothetical protein
MNPLLLKKNELALVYQWMLDEIAWFNYQFVPKWSNEGKVDLIKNIIGKEEYERFEHEKRGVVDYNM